MSGLVAPGPTTTPGGRPDDVESQVMIVDVEREEDGRWIAEVPDLPGVMTYGSSRDEAISKVEALALRVLADRLEHSEKLPELYDLFAVPS